MTVIELLNPPECDTEKGRVKTCTKCERSLPITGFFRRSASRDSIRGTCKNCCRGYTDPEKLKKTCRAWWDKHSRDPAVLVRRKENQRRYRQGSPEKEAARQAVKRAKRAGLLVPGCCCVCGTTSGIEAHHHKGYDPEYWLDVEWRCREHHKE